MNKRMPVNENGKNNGYMNYWRTILLCVAIVSITAAIYAIFCVTKTLAVIQQVTPAAEAYQNGIVPQIISLSDTNKATAETATSEAENGTITLIGKEKKLYISSDSMIPLLSESGTGIVIPVSTFGDELHAVTYNSTSDCLQIDGYILQINDNPFEGEKLVEYQQGESTVTVGIIGFDNGNVMVSTVGSMDNVSGKITQILDSIMPYSGSVTVSVMGETVNQSWLSGFEFDTEVAAFTNDTDTVYLSWFDGNIEGAGFDNSIQIGKSLSGKYSDIVDNTTGLIPYIVETDEGTMKYLATSNDILSSVYKK